MQNLQELFPVHMSPVLQDARHLRARLTSTNMTPEQVDLTVTGYQIGRALETIGRPGVLRRLVEFAPVIQQTLRRSCNECRSGELEFISVDETEHGEFDFWFVCESCGARDFTLHVPSKQYTWLAGVGIGFS